MTTSPTAAATPAVIPAPARTDAAPFWPGDPSAAQSRQAAYISSTNASPSGLCSPCAPTLYGFTTGVSQPSDVKCARLGEVALDDGAVLVEVELPDDAEGDDDDEEEEEEELDGEERAMRDFSALGTLVWMPASSARR